MSNTTEQHPYRESGNTTEGMLRKIEAENKCGIEIKSEWEKGQEVPEFIKFLKAGKNPSDIIFYSPETGLMRFYQEGEGKDFDRSLSYISETENCLLTIGIRKNSAVITHTVGLVTP